MDARFYNSEEIDIEKLATNLESIYQAQGYQAQHVGTADQMMVQLKKGGDFESLIGLSAALTVTIQRSGGGVLAMIGQQKWIDKAAVGAVGIIAAPILWPLMLTAGAGAIRQASLGNHVLNTVDGLVRQQLPEIQIGPVPVQLMPQVQQQWAPPPPQYMPPPQHILVPIQQMPPVYMPTQPPMPPQPMYQPPQPQQQAPVKGKLRCPSCNTPYDAGDTFCTGCGKSLVTLCPNCKTEIKDGSSFCPKCGSSTFQALAPTSAQAAQPVLPPIQSKPAVTYTPPPAPKPPVPPVSDIPVYTPPVKPPTPQAPPAKPPVQQAPPSPVYTPPPAPGPYVPPTPQEPAVMPKPTVTFVPAPKQDKPATPKQPPQPPVPYYTPPVNPQPVAPKAKQPASPAPSASPAPPVSPPIAAKPSAQPAFDPTAVWGSLLFSDGKQIDLSGERVLVGRSDHDIIDMQPEVDLSTVAGSDTVSRIHATIEHIGSTFTLTDLNSTNLTRINGKRLEPDKATPINDGDTLAFGKASCTFKKV